MPADYADTERVEGGKECARTVRFCARCDPFFRVRRDMRHTYDEGCELARPGIPPQPWSEQERKAHEFVAEVQRHLEALDG